MKNNPASIPCERFLALDIHKHYVLVGGMNSLREWVLRPRKVQMSRFPEWVQKNLKPTDAVVLESTSNAWEIYDLISPLVAKAVVANPLKVGQIAGSKVKTDKLDVERLLILLIADIVPEVWVPPHHVRDLRAFIFHRWRIHKQIAMTKNRLHSFIHRFNLIPPAGCFSQRRIFLGGRNRSSRLWYACKSSKICSSWNISLPIKKLFTRNWLA